MKTVALAETAASEAHDRISDKDIRVMITMIEYLFTEISRIDPVAAHHLSEARTSLAETVTPAALARPN
jgi:hypothetical protein